MTSMTPNKDCSTVFLSYSSSDRDFAERLAADLLRSGIRIWLDRWELKVGDSITERINQAIQSHDRLIIVLSPSSIRSSWVKRELNSALMKELNTKKVVVLPALLRKCKIPQIISDKKYADFSLSYDDGFKQLLFALSPSLRPPNGSIIHDKIIAPWYRQEDRSLWNIDISSTPPSKIFLYTSKNKRVLEKGLSSPLQFLSYTIRACFAQAASSLFSGHCDDAMPVWAEDGSMLAGVILWYKGIGVIHLNMFEDDTVLRELEEQAVCLAVNSCIDKSIQETSVAWKRCELENVELASCSIRWGEDVPTERRNWQEQYGFRTASCLVSDESVVTVNIDEYSSFSSGFVREETLARTDAMKVVTSRSERIDVTVFLRDTIHDALAIIMSRFPQYSINSIHEENTEGWLACSGDPGNCDIEWLFELERIGDSSKGPSRIRARIHPVWDIIMPLYPHCKEIFVSGTHWSKTDVIKLQDIECTALDAEITIFDQR